MAFDELRRDYDGAPLRKEAIDDNPVEQFRQWFDAAVAAKVDMPNAMSFATVDSSGQPECRILLLKEFDERGFVFFTNYQSRKGEQLEQRPKGSMLFWWREFERQIRISGDVEKISEEESDAYFNQRPRASNLVAMASAQSRPVESRDALEAAVAQQSLAAGDGEIKRPGHWGGYRLIPNRFEFWQGRPDRCHDRFEFQRRGESWTIVRLFP